MIGYDWHLWLIWLFHVISSWDWFLDNYYHQYDMMITIYIACVY
jgi:hypothetical protein